MSKAYEIYRESLPESRQYGSLIENERKAWASIDKQLKKQREKKPKKEVEEILESKTYNEYQAKHKNAKDFSHLSNKLKKMWNNIDKNQDSFIKPQEEKQKTKPKKQ